MDFRILSLGIARTMSTSCAQRAAPWPSCLTQLHIVRGKIFSWHNVALIATQRPTATRVTGFHAILAPAVGRRKFRRRRGRLEESPRFSSHIRVRCLISGFRPGYGDTGRTTIPPRTAYASPLRGGRGHELAGSRLQAVDEIRRALRVAGRGEDRAVVCLENVHPVGDVGGVILARLKRQIKIGTEERGA
jgi:hypothetical protein